MSNNQGELARVTVNSNDEEFYKAFFNLTVAGAAQASVYTGKFLEANRRFCEMLGYSREELLEKTVAEVTHPEDRATDSEQFFKLLREEIPHIVLEKRYRRKDGSFFWANLSVNLLRDAAGVPLRTVSVIVDITASKAAEEKLRESRERFEALTFASAQIVWTTDESGLVNEDSPTWREFTGQTYNEWKGWGWLDALHPEDRRNAEKVWGAAVAAKTFYEVEYRIKHRSGGYRWTLARGVPLRRADGSIHSWVGMNTDIHEQKSSAEKLLETQQRLESSLTGANLGVWTYNAETNIFWADERARRLFGHHPDEILTFETAGANVHPDDLARAQSSFRRAILTGTKLQHEIRVLPPEGGLRWLASYADFVKKNDADAGTLYGVVQDITDRKCAEEQLQTDSEKLAAIIAAQREITSINADYNELLEIILKNAAVLTKAEGASFEFLERERLVYHSVNGMASSFAGFSVSVANSLSGKALQTNEILISNDTENDPRVDREGCRKLGLRSMTVAPLSYLEKPLGVLKLMSSRPAAFGEADVQTLELMRAFLGAVIARKISEERLRDSEEFARSVLESSPDCVKILRLEGQIEFMNGNGICLLELESVSAVENKCWQDFWDGEDHSRASETVKRAAAGETVRFQGFCATATGKPKWWDVITTPIRYGGKVIKLLVVSRDITQLKLVEREREELLIREQAARREAENANRSKDEFLAMLSHELRTPLNAMYGWTQLLQTNQNDPQTVQTGIEVIARNVRLQNALIEDLLDVSRIISGKLRLETDEIRLLPLIREAVEACAPSAQKKNIQLQTNFDLTADEARGDSFRLQQIVSNLLTNAVKFTPAGGKIEIKVSRENDFAKLEIRDNGIGIAPELLPYVFDRFRQADASMKRQFGGLGLGLTIVKYLAELHGGEVSAASEGAEKGSTFTVKLPLLPVAAPEAASFSSDAETSANENVRKLADLKILLVDDNQDALELLSFVLETQGAKPARANSVSEALLLLERERFDLLISDLGIAGMDGFDLIASVRKSDAERSQPLPAIALTGYASADDRERVLKAGFNLYFSKPIDIEQISAEILTLLKAHK